MEAIQLKPFKIQVNPYMDFKIIYNRIADFNVKEFIVHLWSGTPFTLTSLTTRTLSRTLNKLRRFFKNKKETNRTD
jgi:hypothetical protein